MVLPLRIAQNEKMLAFHVNIHQRAPTADKASDNQVDKTTDSVDEPGSFPNHSSALLNELMLKMATELNMGLTIWD